MAKSAYPTGAEVIALALRAGITVAATEAAYAVDAAVDEFHERTGRQMLRDGSARARRYDPPVDGWLDLAFDLAVLTSVEYSPQGGTTETLTENTDFVLESYNTGDAEPLGQPYSAITFYRRWYQPVLDADRRSIVVTAKWGWGASFPESVWQAILHKAGAMLLPEAGAALSGGRSETVDAGVIRIYTTNPHGAVRAAWNDEFERAVRRWRRW